MSKVFYDHLIVLEEVEVQIASSNLDRTEREEIHQMIEELVHYRVMTKILDHLPRQHHEEFLGQFHKAPYHEGVLQFLKEKVEDIEELIREEISVLKKELLKDLSTSKTSKKP